MLLRRNLHFSIAVPVMFGLSAIKIIKFGFGFTALELCITLLGMLVAFVVFSHCRKVSDELYKET